MIASTGARRTEDMGRYASLRTDRPDAPERGIARPVSSATHGQLDASRAVSASTSHPGSTYRTASSQGATSPGRISQRRCWLGGGEGDPLWLGLGTHGLRLHVELLVADVGRPDRAGALAFGAHAAAPSREMDVGRL